MSYILIYRDGINKKPKKFRSAGVKQLKERRKIVNEVGHTFPLLPKRIVWSNLKVSSVFLLDNLNATEAQNARGIELLAVLKKQKHASTT